MKTQKHSLNTNGNGQQETPKSQNKTGSKKQRKHSFTLWIITIFFLSLTIFLFYYLCAEDPIKVTKDPSLTEQNFMFFVVFRKESPYVISYLQVLCLVFDIDFASFVKVLYLNPSLAESLFEAVHAKNTALVLNYMFIIYKLIYE